MNTLYARSTDGTRIAYDRCGRGPPIVLVHGGGVNRHDWHRVGYVERLQASYTAIALDLRGHGDSDKPTDPAAYTTEKMGEDILAVADACEAERFVMWAMSFGGKISRYLAARSEKVIKYVLIGTPLGPGVVGERRQMALDFLAHWTPIMQAQYEGTLDPKTLSPQDQNLTQRLDVPSMLGWVRAMLDWPSVEPRDFRCPTLWLIGSEDQHAVDSLRTYEQSIEGSLVQVRVVKGLDHDTAFDEIDRVYPLMLSFTQQI